MHGVRYLDIRVGYYRATEPQFWVNHGISRQQPLIKVLRQVRDFVLETNEIVIFDVQEFPVGECAHFNVIIFSVLSICSCALFLDLFLHFYHLTDETFIFMKTTYCLFFSMLSFFNVNNRFRQVNGHSSQIGEIHSE